MTGGEGYSMPRRARGEGTITYHEPSGLYMAQVSVGRRPDGKRDRRTVYGRTPEEVADKLLELRRQVKDGTLPQPNRYTVQEWADQWLRDVSRLRGTRKEGLAENTLEVYKNALRYITDAYGSLLLKELTGQHLTDLYVRMRDKGLSLRQCEIVHNVAGMMLRAAVRARLIPRDVSEDVSYVPKPDYDDEPRALSPEEFEALLAEASKMRGTRGRWAAAFRLAVDAALGRGELLGVQWGDLNLREGLLHVRRQILRKNGGALVAGPLKTKARRRTVPIRSPLLKSGNGRYGRKRASTSYLPTPTSSAGTIAVGTSPMSQHRRKLSTRHSSCAARGPVSKTPRSILSGRPRLPGWRKPGCPSKRPWPSRVTVAPRRSSSITSG